MLPNIEASLKALYQINGFIAAAIVDTDSGMTLGTIGGGENFDIEIAAAANRNVVKAKIAAASALGLTDTIDDILITLTSQYHLVRPTSREPSMFIYLALNRAYANLALARRDVTEIEKRLVV